MKLTGDERALFVYRPALVLLVAFVAVCVQAGTPWPWNCVASMLNRVKGRSRCRVVLFGGLKLP